MGNDPVDRTDPTGTESASFSITGLSPVDQSKTPSEVLSQTIDAAVGIGSLFIPGLEEVGIERFGAKGVEVVERAMSRAELRATQETGLLRGGRDGEHFVSNSVNRSAQRAQQRLALPTKPEVRVKMEVPKGRFSEPSRVKPDNKMPGGGTERTSTGEIPVKIKKIDEMTK